MFKNTVLIKVNLYQDKMAFRIDHTAKPNFRLYVTDTFKQKALESLRMKYTPRKMQPQNVGVNMLTSQNQERRLYSYVRGIIQ